MTATTSTWLGENLWIAGAVIVGVVAVLALWIVVDAIRRAVHTARQRAREVELLQLKLDAARSRKAQAEKAPGTWSGWRKFEIKRKEPEDPAGLACSFYLAPHDGKPIPAFEPGQYLTFRLMIPGQDKPVIRCYSLSDSTNPDHYRVTIKHLRATTDKPAGVGSSFFHERLDVGDIVDVGAPAGKFFLDMAWETPVVLLSAGIGITPVLSMLNSITERGSSRETWFFYGVRNRDEHAMYEHLNAVAREHENVHLHVCYSDPRNADRPGHDYHHAGRVCIELLRELLPSSNYHYYMCGPPAMMEALREGLADWSVPEAHVHWEKFSPSRKPVPRADPSRAAGDGPTVCFKKSDKTVVWDASFDNLLEFAEAHGVKIDNDCRAGQLGCCKTAILNGAIEYTNEPAYDECEDGTCLVCSCVPSGSLELDA